MSTLGERIKRLENFIDGSSMQCAEMSQRIEKMEKALSEEMAKVREMDGILAGVVKRTGYMSEDKSKWPAMPAPTFINRQYSDELLKEAKELNIDPYNLAFAKYMGATVRNVPIDEITGYAPEAPAPTAPYPAPSTLINKAELVAWLDAEIVKANNMMSDAVTPVLMAEAMVATYKAVKAHIEG